MSATTKDRANAGKDAWRVNVQSLPPEDGETIWVGSDEFPSFEAARAFADALLLEHPEAYASIRRGTYMATEFDDDEYGTIYDADFEEDEHWYADGYVNRSGAIEWEVFS